MAEIKQGILGGVKGKVGTVVGVDYRGKNVIRAKPRKTNKDPSQAQLQQRSKLTIVVQFLTTIRDFVNAHYPEKIIEGSRKLGYDQIRSTLMTQGVVVEKDSINILKEKVVLSVGPLPPAPISKISFLKKNRIKVQWDNSTTNGLTASDDILTLLMYNEVLNVFEKVEHVGTRESKYNNVAIPENWNKGKIHFWSVWSTIDNAMYSTSLYHNTLDLSDAPLT